MIHQYKLGGYNIVLDVNSGCVHSVDDVAYDIIGMYEDTDHDDIKAFILDKYSSRPDVTPEEIDEVFSDIEDLKAAGKLFSEDVFLNAAFDFKKRTTVIKALCLHIAHGCNLNCRYCFAGNGEYNGRGLMSFDTGRRAIDFLIENSGTRHNLEVDFFGGEPLLNFEVVKQLVAYGRSLEKEHNKKFRFTLTTNGVLLDKSIMDFCNREMSNVVLSLDGRRDVHDRLRRFPNGRGSYDIILPKFKEFADSRNQSNYYIRGTYTHYNTDFASDIINIADLGFKEISIEPVVAPPDADYALRDEDLPVLLSEYERLAFEMLKRRREGRPFTFFHYMIDLTGGPCIVKRISGCGSGTEYLAVTPWGDLYPCHQLVDDPEFLLGNIWDGIKNQAICSEFKLCNVYAHEECKSCFARLYCSGGCAANAYHSTGSITGVYRFGCDLHRKRIECAIMLKVAEMEDAEAHAENSKAI